MVQSIVTLSGYGDLKEPKISTRKSEKPFKWSSLRISQLCLLYIYAELKFSYLVQLCLAGASVTAQPAIQALANKYNIEFV